MKALSLKQPFAELVVSGRKTIELRTWNTSFRGEFLVHASGNTDFKKCEEFGFKDLPRRAIVGRANLVGVVRYESRGELLVDASKHLGVDFHSKYPIYGFVLENPERIVPKSMPGALGFFTVII